MDQATGRFPCLSLSFRQLYKMQLVLAYKFWFWPTNATSHNYLSGYHERIFFLTNLFERLPVPNPLRRFGPLTCNPTQAARVQASPELPA